jgi:hypothetical protein
MSIHPPCAASPRIALLIAFAAALVACGGGGGDDAAIVASPSSSPSPAPSPTPAPTPAPVGMSLASTDPADGQLGVATDASPRATFALPIKAGTVNVNSLVLRDGNRRVLGTTFVSGAQATFSPKVPFSLLTAYQLEMTSAITSESGLAFAGVTTTFLTRDGTWKPAVMVSENNAFLGAADNPSISFDPLGNALAVWTQSGIATRGIWANRFDAATGAWGSAELIERNPGDAEAPRVATGGFGTAVAVWSQRDGANYSIWASHFSGGLWGAAQRIESDDTRTDNPQVAIDNAGNAIAVWPQVRVGDATATQLVRTSRFDDATKTWSAPAFIENDASGPAIKPTVAMDPNSGNAVAVWTKDDAGSIGSVWASRYNAAAAVWSAPELLETSDTGSAIYPALAMNGAGDALVAWTQSDGSKNNLHANWLNGGSGVWSGPAELDRDVGFSAPAVALGAKQGNLLVAWTREAVIGGSVWASVTQAGESWGAPKQVASTTDAIGAIAALDAHGNALVGWRRTSSGVVQIQTSRFSANTKRWGAPADALTSTAFATAPSIATDPTGRALLVWLERDAGSGRLDIKASRFD